jgi:putative flavoprotein involved in K+ transport
MAATGLFGAPRVPALPGLASYTGELLHAAAYRRPAAYTGKRVVVVGGGSSAIQIAVELAEVARVSLATRSPVEVRRAATARRGPAPLAALQPHRPAATRPTRRSVRRRPRRRPVHRRARFRRPERHDMLTTFTADGVRWSDGTHERVDNVFGAPATARHSSSCPRRPSSPTAGRQRRGISRTVPGLGYVGVPGQTGVASAMLRGVCPDAAHVVRQLQRHLATSHRGPVPVRSGAAMAEPTTDPTARLPQLVGALAARSKEGGVPPVTFVVTNTVAAATVGGVRALPLAVTAAVGAGLVLALVAVVQRRQV